MAIEQTLSIIKPDAVAKNAIGEIMSRFEANGLRPKAMKMVHMTREQAKAFYAVHADKPFYDDLVAFMQTHEDVWRDLLNRLYEGYDEWKAGRDSGDASS